MAKKNTQTKPKAKGTTTGRTAAEVARGAWQQAVEAVVSVEQQAEKQVRQLLKKNKLSGKQAAQIVADLKGRFERERKKATRGLDAQLKALQARIQKERASAGKRVGQAVQHTLASLNIPSRREISDLTRKVEELSRKIDALKRRK
jgi:polyhydroxyalkanoate synthesis regulator phasin